MSGKEALLAGNIYKVIDNISLKAADKDDCIVRKSEELKAYYDRIATE